MGFGSENCTSCSSGFFLVIGLTLPALVRTGCYIIWLVSLISVRARLQRGINPEFIPYRFLIGMIPWYLHIYFTDLGNFGWTCNSNFAPNHSSYGQGMAESSFPLYKTCELRGIKRYFIEGEWTNHIAMTPYKMTAHLSLEYNAQLWSFTSQRI